MTNRGHPSDEHIRAEVAEIQKKRRKRLEREKRNPKKKPKPLGPEVTFESRKAGYGTDYRKILSETRRVLDDLAKYVPAYDPEGGL